MRTLQLPRPSRSPLGRPLKCVPAAMNLTHDNGDYLPEPGLHSSGVVRIHFVD